MAEIVEYRVERTIDELNLLVEFKLLTEGQAKEIIAKRQNFEYALRKRTKTKLDFLRYIRYEVNLLESIDKYRKTIIANYYKSKKEDDDELLELERKILLLQAKKLNDVVRSRSAHISSLFRKLTTSFQFDKKLWLAYIDFAKSRNWNSRVSALYWRLLRVASEDEDIWIAAANHEMEVNKAYDSARGLYLRALRHHPTSQKVWSEYFRMELQFMSVVDQRARIVFKTLNNKDEDDKESSEIWADANENLDDEPEEKAHDSDDERKDEAKGEEEDAPVVKPIDENDTIIAGHLPIVIYKNATNSLNCPIEFARFLVSITNHISKVSLETKGLLAVQEKICTDLQDKITEEDPRVATKFSGPIDKFDDLKEQIQKLNFDDENNRTGKRLKITSPSKVDILYECYKKNNIEAARKKFLELEKSVKNQTLSLYVGMLQVEMLHLASDKSNQNIDKIRSIYERALTKFGKTKPKLWYEYLQFELQNAKTLEDFERINQIYLKAQATLIPTKVDKVIEKYTLMQNVTSANIEYSDYSDIDD